MSDSHRTVRKQRCPVTLALAAACLLDFAALSAEPDAGSNAPPRATLAVAASESPNVRLKPGFRLEVVATDPAITAPVAMAFDENGRLFVLERPDSLHDSGANANVGSIRLLEDTEGEGQFNASTVYATNLAWASALACYSGGVFVAAGPELLYLKDTKTNGVANVREAIFGGFAITNRAGALALANNFNWGLDNRIHAASAGGNGIAPAYAAPGAPPVSLTGADFSFDPRALSLAADAGPGLSGLSFDNGGRKFTCDYLRPLRTPMCEPRYLARNPFCSPPATMLDAASPATQIFRLVSVTNRAPNQAGAPVAQVLASTWLTNACGCVVYRGTAFPTNYVGSVFVADPVAHVIHRFVLGEFGVEVKAFRSRDETNTEFLVSADPAFCPIQLANGPDGALYVLDRRDADDRGRIYRIVPAGFKRPKLPHLAKATTYELVAFLSHPNGWHRDTAARLLYERRDPKAVPLLAAVLSGSRLPLARLQALHALDGLNALTQAHVLVALRDREPQIREHAVLLCERLSQKGPLPDAVWSQLQAMSADPSPRVRYQLAFTVGELHRTNSAEVLAALLVRDPADLWMQAAVFSSLADGAGDLFLVLTRDGRVRRDPTGQEWLLRLASMIGLKGTAAEVGQVLGFVAQLRNESVPAFALLHALGEGLHWTRSSLALVDPDGRMQPFYSQAMNAMLTPSLPVATRVGAMQVLAVGPYNFANAGDLLLIQLGSGQPFLIQATALATLGRYADPRLGPAVIQRWRLLPPEIRGAAFSALLARDERVGEVLKALENGNLDATDLPTAQMNFLRTHRDSGIRQRALRLFGPVPLERPDAVQRLKPALALRGTAARGREIFAARCAACHQRTGATLPIGPDLSGVRLYGKEGALRAILEPNATSRSDSPTCVVTTAEGENLIGVMREENAATITLQPARGGPIVLPRDNILSLQTQPWSLMPDRLEAGLTAQNMADLLEYVMTAAQ
jgi:putative membrane-bound dehydrogenase-like protein